MTKRADQKTKTNALIRQTAAALFAVQGYERTTIRELATAAGLSTGAIFAHYPDKAAVYAAVHGHGPLTPEQGRLLAARLVVATGGESIAAVVGTL